jgi:DNA-binding PadR family transcriptional regulator
MFLRSAGMASAAALAGESGISIPTAETFGEEGQAAVFEGRPGRAGPLIRLAGRVRSDGLDAMPRRRYLPFRLSLQILKELVADTLPVIKGTLDVLVLKALSSAAMHGFEITSWIEARSGGELGVEDSALDQALYRLEGRGLVEASWGVTENNRRARYYALTAAGFEHLGEESARLTRYAAALTGLLALETSTG